MSRVSLRFIGCGDAFASGGRLNTCLLLDGGSDPVVLDCGATTLMALKRSGIAPEQLGYVALSHLHGDHFGGLPWLILDGRFAKRTRPLVIAGPPTTRERLERAFEALYPGGFAAENPFELSFVEMDERTPYALGPATVTPFEVVHNSGAPSYALRVEYGGKVVAFSGDTEWTDNLLDAARGADLFVCECNYFDKQVPGHLDYRTLSDKRRQLECERLVLTHMSDDVLERLEQVDAEAAADGMVLEV